MKYIIGSFLLIVVIGIGACGGEKTTTVVQQAPPATTPTQTQTQPQRSSEEKLADTIVHAYVAQHKNVCQAFAELPYNMGLHAFTKGYLSTNSGNYPNAHVVYDAILKYCEDITA